MIKIILETISRIIMIIIDNNQSLLIFTNRAYSQFWQLIRLVHKSSKSSCSKLISHSDTTDTKQLLDLNGFLTIFTAQQKIRQKCKNFDFFSASQKFFVVGCSVCIFSAFGLIQLVLFINDKIKIVILRHALQESLVSAGTCGHLH